MFRNMAQVLLAGVTQGQRLSEKMGLQAVGGLGVGCSVPGTPLKQRRR